MKPGMQVWKWKARIPRLRRSLAGCLLSAAFVALVGGLVQVSAQTTNQPADLLARVAENMGRVQSVFTRFEQERHLSLFQEPLRSAGYLCFEKPGRLRWQVVQPYQSILISDGKSVAQFERVNDQWKKLELGLADVMQNITAQIGAVMEGRYATRQQDYSVSVTKATEGPVVTLTPRHPAMRKMMQAIEIHLAPDLRGTRRVVLREAGGDFTDIRFSEQLADPPLPPGTFQRGNPTELEQILKSVQRPKPRSTGKAGSQ